MFCVLVYFPNILLINYGSICCMVIFFVFLLPFVASLLILHFLAALMLCSILLLKFLISLKKAFIFRPSFAAENTLRLSIRLRTQNIMRTINKISMCFDIYQILSSVPSKIILCTYYS